MDVNLPDVVPYLEHPLTLVGFFVFLFFSFARLLVSKGVIPPLPPSSATVVLMTILRYGFVFGILIILLGFGLRYRQLSHAEQQNVVRMLHAEFGANLRVAAELAANIESLLQNTRTVAEVLRHEGIPILPIVFPEENLRALAESRSSLDTADGALRRLENSGLRNNRDEVRKLHEAGQAIAATIERTWSTLLSLADQEKQRYQFTREVWVSQLDVLRRIDVFDVTAFQEVYGSLASLRNEYDVVVQQCLDYLQSVSEFFDRPGNYLSRTELAEVLASERLAFSFISRYGSQLASLAEHLVERQTFLEQELAVD